MHTSPSREGCNPIRSLQELGVSARASSRSAPMSGRVSQISRGSSQSRGHRPGLSKSKPFQVQRYSSVPRGCRSSHTAIRRRLSLRYPPRNRAIRARLRRQRWRIAVKWRRSCSVRHGLPRWRSAPHLNLLRSLSRGRFGPSQSVVIRVCNESGILSISISGY